MKILYIGNYRDGTGWGEACLNNILALDAVGLDVVPRPIFFNEGKAPIPSIIEKLERKNSKGSTVCIQHTLPPNYIYNGKMKQICIYETETLVFKDTNWQKYINMMDEAWVPTETVRVASLNSDVKIPLKIVPHCLPVEKCIDRGHAEIEELKGCFNFCFVGEFSIRKNFGGILRAFHSEFHPSEPVNLFFKINKAGKSGDECLDIFKKYSDYIKGGLKLRDKYKQEVVVTGMLEKTQLLSLMAQCHCFVAVSHGEAWCYPALEAMALGVPVIYLEKGGVDFAVGMQVKSFEAPCHSANDTLENIYTGDSTWVYPDINHLRKTMREMYELWKNSKQNYEKLSNKAKKVSQEYNHFNVGSRMLKLLETNNA